MQWHDAENKIDKAMFMTNFCMKEKALANIESDKSAWDKKRTNIQFKRTRQANKMYESDKS